MKSYLFIYYLFYWTQLSKVCVVLSLFGQFLYDFTSMCVKHACMCKIVVETVISYQNRKRILHMNLAFGSDFFL